jgi:hypothetical protein
MQNDIYMRDSFESQKNMKATGYTLGVCIMLVILFFLVSWTLPAPQPPPVEDGIEVNLGNSDQGMGTDQPYLPGKPSAQDHEKYTPPRQAVVTKEAVKDVETDDDNKDDAPVIKKAPVTKPKATKLPDKDVVRTPSKPVKHPETTPTRPKPRPKALMHGVNGNGTGGNDADDFKPGGNQGIAGGHGDQGAPGGNPNSNNYTGGGRGHGGISGSVRGRTIRSTPSFTDDFNENAKVAVDVHVDAAGNVVDATYQPRGSTTSSSTYKEIAIRKAKLVKFSPGDGESFGTLILNFQVHN